MSDKLSNSQPRPNTIKVGGQAVIEGVMMRSPHTVATAVRKPNGEILVESFPYIALSKRNKILGLPVIRGVVTLGEALYLGVKTLNWSAAKAVEAEKVDGKDTGKTAVWDKLLSVLTMVLSIAAAVGIFMLIPYWGAGAVRDDSGSQFLFHAIAGLIRIVLFLLYLYLISLWSEIRRVFEYHGAEHKSIFAYESTGEATIKTAAENVRFHPRCGTSFLLITAIVIIFIFALIDSALIPIIGEYRSPFHRLLVHLPFIPLVAGLSYEVLKLSGEKADNKLWGILIKPGLWLQYLTTREPDESQLEVAVAALKSSLDGSAQSRSSSE